MLIFECSNSLFLLFENLELESLRVMRELQELSKAQLSALTGIPQSTISAIEGNRVNLDVERAKLLARALRCHPAVLVFPDWEMEPGQAA